MTGFEAIDPVQELESWLIQELPGIELFLQRARLSEGDPTSEYWLFAYVVAPYLNEALASGDEPSLRTAWAALEKIVVNGPASARNELLVVAFEELDLPNFIRFLGQPLQDAWFEHVCWYPPDANWHVDDKRYRSRWSEEIERIGGLAALSPEAEMRVRYQLKTEFKIRDLGFT